MQLSKPAINGTEVILSDMRMTNIELLYKVIFFAGSSCSYIFMCSQYGTGFAALKNLEVSVTTCKLWTELLHLLC